MHVSIQWAHTLCRYSVHGFSLNVYSIRYVCIRYLTYIYTYIHACGSLCLYSLRYIYTYVTYIHTYMHACSSLCLYSLPSNISNFNDIFSFKMMYIFMHAYIHTHLLIAHEGPQFFNLNLIHVLETCPHNLCMCVNINKCMSVCVCSCVMSQWQVPRIPIYVCAYL